MFSGFANLFGRFWIENTDTELVEMGFCRIKDKGWIIRGVMCRLLHECVHEYAYHLQLGFLFQLSFASGKDFKMCSLPNLHLHHRSPQRPSDIHRPNVH